MRVSSGSGAPFPVRQPHQNCGATPKRRPSGVYRAFRPFPRVAGPLWGPSSNHPLCGWYLIYIGVSKNTILARLKKYRLLYEYDPHDIYSVLNFFKFLQKR